MRSNNSRSRWVLGLLALLAVLAGCGPRPEPFANGTVKMAGPVAVALELQPNPPSAGKDSELVFVLRQDGQPVGPDRATAELLLDMPKMSMNLPRMPLQSAGEGRWRAQTTFPMAGGWSATVQVTTRDATPVEATFQFDVGP